jgi:hypothetical protein
MSGALVDYLERVVDLPHREAALEFHAGTNVHLDLLAEQLLIEATGGGNIPDEYPG